MNAAARVHFREIVDHALAARPAAMRRQFGVFLKLVRWSAFFRYGAPLDRLAAERRDAVLRAFQESPIALFRKGFWGLKALVFMGYYARPEVMSSLAYSPSKRGNEMLHA